MTAGAQRKLQRRAHLVAAATLLTYVYVPIGSDLEAAVRIVFFPRLAVTGLAMWQAPRIRRALRAMRSGENARGTR
jgi:hypothetical protein